MYEQKKATFHGQPIITFTQTRGGVLTVCSRCGVFDPRVVSLSATLPVPHESRSVVRSFSSSFRVGIYRRPATTAAATAAS